MEKFIIPGSVALRLQFEELGDISLLQLASIFYDFTLLHDCLVLTTIPKYQEYKFSQYFWYRKGRPLNPEHMLYVKQISHKSPVSIVVVITTVSAVMGIPLCILKTIEKISNWKLNREKLESEVKNLKLNNKLLYIENKKSKTELDIKLSERKAMGIYLQIVKRIGESKPSVIDAEFYVIEEGKEKKPNQ